MKSCFTSTAGQILATFIYKYKDDIIACSRDTCELLKWLLTTAPIRTFGSQEGSSVLLPSTVVAINSDDTFGLSRVLTPEESEAQIKKVTISSDVGKHHIVPWMLRLR